MYANTLFRVSSERMSQWDISLEDKRNILKVKVSILPILSIYLFNFQAQDNHAKAFNRFIRNHPQWKKAVTMKIDIERMLSEVEESALIYSMYNLNV